MIPFKEVSNEAVCEAAKYKSKDQGVQDKDAFDVLGNNDSKNNTGDECDSKADVDAGMSSHPSHECAEENNNVNHEASAEASTDEWEISVAEKSEKDYEKEDRPLKKNSY